MENRKPYIGLYEHNMDSKGRVMIPAELREQLGETFYITSGLDNCIFVFDEENFREMDSHLRDLSINRKNERAFQRMFYAPARQVTLDSHGRILIPQHLREHANLKKNLVITGNANRVEIWDKETRDKYYEAMDMNFEDLAEELEGL